jgi:hypothetical protein
LENSLPVQGFRGGHGGVEAAPGGDKPCPYGKKKAQSNVGAGFIPIGFKLRIGF